MTERGLTDGHQLLVAAIEHIETHPEEWDQTKWRCETGGCVAGTMANLSPEVRWEGLSSSGSRQHYVTNGFASDHVSNWAAGKLGLNSNVAKATLFWQTNSLEDLKLYAKKILDGESLEDED